MEPCRLSTHGALGHADEFGVTPDRRSKMTQAAWMSLVLLCAAVATVSAAVSAGQAGEAEKTAVVRRFDELIARINAGDRDTLTEYATSSFVPEMLKPVPSDIIDFLIGQYTNLGGLTPRRTMKSSDQQVEVLVQAVRKPDKWFRFVVNIEPQPPHRIRGVFLLNASAAMAEAPAEAVADADRPARFGDMVDRLAADDSFSGVVLLARHGQPVFRKAYGEADKADHRPNRLDTKFSFASLGKMFTAVAVAQLVEQGKIRYTDRVAPYLPGWLSPQAAETVTVEHLLMHTSGLGDYLQAVRAHPGASKYETLVDYRPVVAKDVPAFPPGSKFRYSNNGYVLLGALVETLSGQTYYDYVRDHVFVPAGMTRTDFPARDRAADDRAVGYDRVEDPAGGGIWKDNAALMVGRGTPAGGGYTTADDLLAFVVALQSGKLLGKASVDQLLDPRVNMVGTGKRYGYGFTIMQRQSGGKIYGHEGGFPGVSALLEADPETGYVLVVLSNYSAAAPPMADAWHDLLSPAASR